MLAKHAHVLWHKTITHKGKRANIVLVYFDWSIQMMMKIWIGNKGKIREIKRWKLISVMGEFRCHASSATQRQTGWGLQQCRWASVDLDGFLEQTAAGDWFRWDSRRAGSKRQPARCSRKTQDKFAIVAWRRSFCTVTYVCMHERTCIFLRRVCMHLDWCFGHHACVGVYVRRVLWTPAYNFANTLATGCAYALMHVQFVRSALGERGWGLN